MPKDSLHSPSRLSRDSSHHSPLPNQGWFIGDSSTGEPTTEGPLSNQGGDNASTMMATSERSFGEMSDVDLADLTDQTLSPADTPRTLGSMDLGEINGSGESGRESRVDLCSPESLVDLDGKDLQGEEGQNGDGGNDANNQSQKMEDASGAQNESVEKSQPMSGEETDLQTADEVISVTVSVKSTESNAELHQTDGSRQTELDQTGSDQIPPAETDQSKSEENGEEHRRRESEQGTEDLNSNQGNTNLNETGNNIDKDGEANEIDVVESKSEEIKEEDKEFVSGEGTIDSKAKNENDIEIKDEVNMNIDESDRITDKEDVSPSSEVNKAGETKLESEQLTAMLNLEPEKTSEDKNDKVVTDEDEELSEQKQDNSQWSKCEYVPILHPYALINYCKHSAMLSIHIQLIFQSISALLFSVFPTTYRCIVFINMFTDHITNVFYTCTSISLSQKSMCAQKGQQLPYS